MITAHNDVAHNVAPGAQREACTLVAAGIFFFIPGIKQDQSLKFTGFIKISHSSHLMQRKQKVLHTGTLKHTIMETVVSSLAFVLSATRWFNKELVKS